MELLKEILATAVYPTLIGFAVAMIRLGSEWLSTKGRDALVEAVQRQAGRILLESGGPSGHPDPALVQKMADEAEQLLRQNFNGTLKKLGPVAPGTLSQMIQGELGKLLIKNGAN